MRATGALLLAGLVALLVLLIRREGARQKVTAEFLPPGSVPAVPGEPAPVQGRIIGSCLGAFGTAECPEGTHSEIVDGSCVCIEP